MEAELTKVLLVTKDIKISSPIKQMLIAPLFEVSEISDFNDARRRLSQESFHIVIVDSGDGEGTDFAIDISENPSTVLLLVATHMFDQVSYKVEAFGVLTLTKPFDQFYFYNMIKVALAVNAKIQKLTFQTIRLKEKMEEIRIINRAKMLLMSHKSMTEEEAHRYIEKTAMDKCVKRTVLAQDIIRDFS